MTWTRRLLKDNAKQEMRKSFKHYIGVDIVAILIMLGSVFPISLIFVIPLIAAGGAFTAGVWVAYVLFFVVLIASVYLIDIPLTLGILSCYIRAPQGEKHLSNLFFVFKSGKYWTFVGAMFRVNLVIFLWSLLFVIPGYVKMYQYQMVPYILIENPGMSGKEAMRISRQMTDGHKGRMFVLDLSFIGWIFLAMLPYIILYSIGFALLMTEALAIGTILIIASMLVLIAAIAVLSVYMQATMTQLYFVLRANFFALYQNRQSSPAQSPQGFEGQGYPPPPPYGNPPNNEGPQ